MPLSHFRRPPALLVHDIGIVQPLEDKAYRTLFAAVFQMNAIGLETTGMGTFSWNHYLT